MRTERYAGQLDLAAGLPPMTLESVALGCYSDAQIVRMTVAQVTCPTCGADVRETCTDPDGRARAKYHATRQRAAAHERLVGDRDAG